MQGVTAPGVAPTHYTARAIVERMRRAAGATECTPTYLPDHDREFLLVRIHLDVRLDVAQRQAIRVAQRNHLRRQENQFEEKEIEMGLCESLWPKATTGDDPKTSWKGRNRRGETARESLTQRQRMRRLGDVSGATGVLARARAHVCTTCPCEYVVMPVRARVHMPVRVRGHARACTCTYARASTWACARVYVGMPARVRACARASSNAKQSSKAFLQTEASSSSPGQYSVTACKQKRGEV